MMRETVTEHETPLLASMKVTGRVQLSLIAPGDDPTIDPNKPTAIGLIVGDDKPGCPMFVFSKSEEVDRFLETLYQMRGVLWPNA